MKLLPTFFSLRTRFGNRLLATIACVVVLPGVAQAQVIQSQGGGGLWNQTSTWNTGTLPTAGSIVTIQPGHSVTLNTNVGIQDLAHLIVDGTLRVADTMNYQLGASRIDVGPNAMGALFEIGTTTQPFQHEFNLTLTDRHLSATYNSPTEHKSFVVHGGSCLELHGRNQAWIGGTKLSWMRLQNGHNLVSGDSLMQLESTPNWDPADRVVIASTDFDALQYEIVSVQSMSGSTVNFTPPLLRRHHGSIEFGVDERAEVGLLTHNILIHGDPVTLSQRRGGHMMFHGMSGGPPMIHVEHIALQDMGWHGALGRYPLHFHLAGNAVGSYIRGCSVERSFNRAIVVHETNDVLVEDNVAVDHWGHGYYLEHGNEVRNTFSHNLGLVTRSPDPGWAHVHDLGDPWSTTGNAPFFKDHDIESSTWWITNLGNTFVNNAAAGSISGHGYWADRLGVPTYWLPGPGMPVPPMLFSGNVAHSNRLNGFNHDDERMFVFDVTLPKPPQTEQVYYEFTAYKNGRGGVWTRAFGQTRWYGARVADNGLGFYLASHGWQEDYQHYLTPYSNIGMPNVEQYNFSYLGAPGSSASMLDSCIIVGETNNLGNPDLPVELAWSPQARSLPEEWFPELMVKGVELYDGLILMVGCQFVNFVDTTLPWPVTTAAPPYSFNYRASAGISSRGHHSWHMPGNPWAVDPRNTVLACTFTNVAHPVLFPIPHIGVMQTFPHPLVGSITVPMGSDGVSACTVYDVDGCLGAGANTYHANNTPLLRPTGVAAPTGLVLMPEYDVPVVIPGPGSAGDNAVGQFFMIMGSVTSAFYGDTEWWNANPAGVLTSVTKLSIDAVTRPGQSQEVTHPHPLYQPYLRWFQGCLLLNHGASYEHYRVNYPSGHNPANDPRKFEFKLRFSPANRFAIFEFPFDGSKGAPVTGNIRFQNDTPTLGGTTTFPSTQVTTWTSLPTTAGNAWSYDSTTKRLYLRIELRPAFLGWMGNGYLPIFSGREVIVEVDT